MYRHGNTVQGDFYRACSINQLLLSITFARHFSEKTIQIFKKNAKNPIDCIYLQYPRQAPPLLRTQLGEPPFQPRTKGCCSHPGIWQNHQHNKGSYKFRLKTSINMDAFKQPLGGFCCAGASFPSGSSENNNQSLCLKRIP